MIRRLTLVAMVCLVAAPAAAERPYDHHVVFDNSLTTPGHYSSNTMRTRVEEGTGDPQT